MLGACEARILPPELHFPVSVFVLEKEPKWDCLPTAASTIISVSPHIGDK